MALNICVAGPTNRREEFCKLIGKKGTSDDLTFYNTNYQGKIIHMLEPTRYPEKVDALIDAAALADHIVFIVDEINAEFGEQVVLLDQCCKNGVIATELDVSKFIAGTSLQNWKVANFEEAKRIVMEELAPLKKEGNPLVFIDHAFEVKGVGTVLLGVVRSGKISVHDKLVAYPEQTTVEIRNIQKNDVDEKEAFGSDRVGLAVKGASSKDVGRGSLLSPTPLAIIRELPAKIEYSKFSQKDSKTLNAYHCLQSAPCRIDGDKIIFEKQIAIAPGEPIVFCDLNKKMRAVGKMIA